MVSLKEVTDIFCKHPLFFGDFHAPNLKIMCPTLIIWHPWTRMLSNCKDMVSYGNTARVMIIFINIDTWCCGVSTNARLESQIV